jgi:hypothetical protein
VILKEIKKPLNWQEQDLKIITLFELKYLLYQFNNKKTMLRKFAKV